MTVSELQDVFLTALVRAHGYDRRRWRMAMGPIRVHPIATHAHCNWSIAPPGDIAEVDRIERLADTLRLRHPIVSG